MVDFCSGDGAKAVIDLAAIQYNYVSIKNFLGKKTVASAVVKSDAYGLGAKRVAVALYGVGCRDFWVSCLSEALEIRQILKNDANIYSLSGFDLTKIDAIKKYSIVPVVNTLQELESISGNNIEFVINVDTGFSRLGLRVDDLPAAVDIAALENVRYVISHLSCSEEETSCFNLREKAVFDDILRMFKNVKASLAASGGAFLSEDFFYDIVRVGGFLYGIQIKKNQPCSQKNVFSLTAAVLQKYEIDVGAKVGYGTSFVSTKKMKIAVLAIGYADGLRRCLANVGCVIFCDAQKNFYKANIVGNISMDFVVVDVCDVPDEVSCVGGEAYVLNEFYSINDMARDAKTIPYEVLTDFNLKSTRFFVEYI